MKFDHISLCLGIGLLVLVLTPSRTSAWFFSSESPEAETTTPEPIQKPPPQTHFPKYDEPQKDQESVTTPEPDKTNHEEDQEQSTSEHVGLSDEDEEEPKARYHNPFEDYLRKHSREAKTSVDHVLEDGGHNEQYDSEAFLGVDEYEKLSESNIDEEEAKRQLSELFERQIDENHDDYIDMQEMVDWLAWVRYRATERDAEAKWGYQPLKDDMLHWSDYKANEYDKYIDDLSKDDLRRVLYDERRWKAADDDEDGVLDRDEFTKFTHPEEFQAMHATAAEELIDSMDKDSDGNIDGEEFLAEHTTDLEGWRETFTSHDLNGDNQLDPVEVVHWLFGEDPVKVEAAHLMEMADENQDQRLSIDEVLDKYTVFMGSEHVANALSDELHDEL